MQAMLSMKNTMSNGVTVLVSFKLITPHAIHAVNVVPSNVINIQQMINNNKSL